jgi:hypothetical protein
MSEFTRCNYCILGDFCRLARSTRRVVKLVPMPLDNIFEGEPLYPQGRDVYIVPPGEPLDDWWAGWLAEVPDHCVC